MTPYRYHRKSSRVFKFVTGILVFEIFMFQLMPGFIAVAEAEEGGRATVGIHGNEDEVEGYGDILIPIMTTEAGGLLFANPRMSVTDSDAKELNIGLGYRHLLTDLGVILGANAYYDGRWTENDNQFNQMGFGLDVMS